MQTLMFNAYIHILNEKRFFPTIYINIIYIQFLFSLFIDNDIRKRKQLSVTAKTIIFECEDNCF